MRRTAERRSDVRAVMPSARSVISLGAVYNADRPYSTENADPSRAAIARYAWGEDYHGRAVSYAASRAAPSRPCQLDRRCRVRGLRRWWV